MISENPSQELTSWNINNQEIAKSKPRIAVLKMVHKCGKNLYYGTLAYLNLLNLSLNYLLPSQHWVMGPMWILCGLLYGHHVG